VHDLAADLPAPRDDEPADLRRDIVDELSDHLRCAVDRERQRAALNGEEAAAQNQDFLWPRVVARFGHPARIARQLWWDAMKESIMSQRTQTATLVIMSLFCVAMMIVTFISLADSRQLARDNQNLNKQLLSQLEELANQPDAAPAPVTPAANTPAEWNQLQFKCVWGSEEGEPVQGVRLMLESESDNTAGIPTSEEVTNADGIADFGKVLYGTYAVSVETPNHLSSRQHVAVRPGQDRTVTIVCPEGSALAKVALQPQFDWNSVPESLKDRVWILCSIQVADGYSDANWSAELYEYEWPAALRENGRGVASGFEDTYEVGAFLINSAGQILPFGFRDQAGDLNSPELNDSQLRRVAHTIWQLPDNLEFVDQIELPPGEYRVYSGIMIADPAEESGRRLLAIHTLPRGGGMAYFSGSGSESFESMRDRMDSQGGRPRGAPRGWGSRDPGRDENSSLAMQLGQLPVSYVVESVPSWNGGFPGSSGYGGSEVSQSQYIVSANGDQIWDFPVEAGEVLFVADLALQVPVGTEIMPTAMYMVAEDDDAIVAGSVIDIVWKGLIVQPDDKVVPEEHVLLTGVEVVAVGGQREDGGIVLKDLYVPLTAEEAGYLMDGSIMAGLRARVSVNSARESAGSPMEHALLARLRTDSVRLDYGVTPVELPTEMKRVWIGVPMVDQELFSQGNWCTVVLHINSAGANEDGPPARELLRNRLLHGALDPKAIRESNYQVAVIVTPEEEQFLRHARSFGTLEARPPNGPSSINPLESNPNLDQLMEELQAIEPDDAGNPPVEPPTDADPAE
jgi:hypothetical protein